MNDSLLLRVVFRVKSESQLAAGVPAAAAGRWRQRRRRQVRYRSGLEVRGESGTAPVYHAGAESPLLAGAHRRSAGDELDIQWSFSGEEAARRRPGKSAPLTQHGKRSRQTTA